MRCWISCNAFKCFIAALKVSVKVKFINTVRVIHKQGAVPLRKGAMMLLITVSQKHQGGETGATG
jgi:hypothetical protein|tara:strand:+ start:7098 stop:7292 length:195 start_codon:yes stop_codon:yes gene_type:complete